MWRYLQRGHGSGWVGYDVLQSLWKAALVIADPGGIPLSPTHPNAMPLCVSQGQGQARVQTSRRDDPQEFRSEHRFVGPSHPIKLHARARARLPLTSFIQLCSALISHPSILPSFNQHPPSPNLNINFTSPKIQLTIIISKMSTSTRKRKQDEELVALPSDDSEEEEE